MNLEKDFVDFVDLLNKFGVDYMVVGGYALAFHGEPRTTGDLDIWIDCNRQNAEKMVVVMKEFGMESLPFKATDFLEPGIINQIGQPPLRIDILNEIDGVRFSKASKSKEFFKYGKIEIPFIGIKEFVVNKKASGRKKDLADVRKIQAKLIGKQLQDVPSKKVRPKK